MLEHPPGSCTAVSPVMVPTHSFPLAVSRPFQAFYHVSSFFLSHRYSSSLLYYARGGPRSRSVGIPFKKGGELVRGGFKKLW